MHDRLIDSTTVLESAIASSAQHSATVAHVAHGRGSYSLLLQLHHAGGPTVVSKMFRRLMTEPSVLLQTNCTHPAQGNAPYKTRCKINISFLNDFQTCIDLDGTLNTTNLFVSVTFNKAQSMPAVRPGNSQEPLFLSVSLLRLYQICQNIEHIDVFEFFACCHGGNIDCALQIHDPWSSLGPQHQSCPKHGCWRHTKCSSNHMRT